MIKVEIFIRKNRFFICFFKDMSNFNDNGEVDTYEISAFGTSSGSSNDTLRK